MGNAFARCAERAARYLPGIAGAFLLLLIGWIVARLLRALAVRAAVLVDHMLMRLTSSAATTHQCKLLSSSARVRERDDRFVGALDRAVVARALMRHQRVKPQAGMGDLFANAAGGYWLGVSGLIQLAVELLPIAKPLAAGKHHKYRH